ncbi:MAG: phosphotransferase, partial [Sulfurimonas sp.]|nr:phosphotransferase [Sulfurimonas sp.]
MSNDLFNTDIFSSNIPKFIKSDFNISKLLGNLIAENYNQISGDIICVEQFQGNEINSNNYKVTTSSGEYLIKKFIDINEYDKLQRILSLSNWLNANDIKLGKTYLSNKDELIVKNKVDNSYWCVFDFINGSFFTGISDRELVSVGSEIGIFFNKLKDIPIELEPIEKIDYFKNSEDLMRAIEKNKKNWVSYFGSDLSSALTDNWEFLQKTYSQLLKYKDTLLHSKLTPCHIDLHPHNLLIEENELKSILDVDSIKLNHTLIAISFSMYKLLRQSIVNRNIKDNSNEISRI